MVSINSLDGACVLPNLATLLLVIIIILALFHYLQLALLKNTINTIANTISTSLLELLSELKTITKSAIYFLRPFAKPLVVTFVGG